MVEGHDKEQWKMPPGYSNATQSMQEQSNYIGISTTDYYLQDFLARGEMKTIKPS
jgi:hypothetical protein